MLCQKNDDSKRAEKYLKESLRLLKKLQKKKATRSTRVDNLYSSTLNNLSVLLVSQWRLEEAEPVQQVQ